MREISSGAEARIFSDGKIVRKQRFAKGYRIPDIDNSLRKSRTKREAKVIEKLSGIIPVPRLIPASEKKLADDKDMIISMEFIPGPKLRDILSKKNYSRLCKTLGKQIAILHNNGIIHGDLTTSNFILSDVDKKLYFIDFGLSFFSDKLEDMAVEIHLLRQALESRHPDVFEAAFETVVSAYVDEADLGEKVMARFEKVEMRGRYKQKS